MSSAESGIKAPLPEQEQHLIAGRYRTRAKIGHGRIGELFSAVDEGYQDIGVAEQCVIQLIPEHIAQDELVSVDTRTGEFLGRA